MLHAILGIFGYCQGAYIIAFFHPEARSSRLELWRYSCCSITFCFRVPVSPVLLENTSRPEGMFFYILQMPAILQTVVCAKRVTGGNEKIHLAVTPATVSSLPSVLSVPLTP